MRAYINKAYVNKAYPHIYVWNCKCMQWKPTFESFPKPASKILKGYFKGQSLNSSSLKGSAFVYIRQLRVFVRLWMFSCLFLLLAHLQSWHESLLNQNLFVCLASASGTPPLPWLLKRIDSFFFLQNFKMSNLFDPYLFHLVMQQTKLITCQLANGLSPLTSCAWTTMFRFSNQFSTTHLQFFWELKFAAARVVKNSSGWTSHTLWRLV